MITENTIIDHMLITIGEGGVSTLETLHPSVTHARKILALENLSFQSRGWWFNTERNFKLSTNEAGQIEIPANALSISISSIDNGNPTEKLRYVKRGNYLYDSYLHTTVINAAKTLDITVQLAVEDMPPAAAYYLMCKCGETAYIADDGDNYKTEELKRARAEAWQLFKQQEYRVVGANALDNSVASALNGVGNLYRGIYGGGQR